MITAQFSKHDNGFITVRVTGHANAAPKGEDYICAMASSFAQAIRQASINWLNQQWIEDDPRLDVEDGKAIITIKPKPDKETIILCMLQMVALEYAILQNQYPEYVKFIPFGNSSELI